MKIQRTRFWLTFLGFVFLMFLAVFAVVKEMEGLALACAASIAVIIERYQKRETERPSGAPKLINDIKEAIS